MTDIGKSPDIVIIKNDVLWQPYRITETKSGEPSGELKIREVPESHEEERSESKTASELIKGVLWVLQNFTENGKRSNGLEAISVSKQW